MGGSVDEEQPVVRMENRCTQVSIASTLCDFPDHRDNRQRELSDRDIVPAENNGERHGDKY